MKVKPAKQSGRFLSEDNPNDWVQIFLSDPRLGGPARFLVCVDGRIIGLETIKFAGASTESSSSVVGTENDVRFFPESAEPRFYPITKLGVIFAKNTRNEISEKVNIKATHTKFASQEQQDRAIEMLVAAVGELRRNYPNLVGAIKFSEDIWTKLERGDFIE